MNIFNSFKDKATSTILIMSCCSIVSLNTSTIIEPLNIVSKGIYSATNHYGNMSTILKYYEMPKNKFKVEIEAQEMFGNMREATVIEQKNIQDNIDNISIPTGFKFWD